MSDDGRIEIPDVSVIIAAYAARDFIARAIDSVLAQHHGSFEILVAPDEPDDYGFLAGRDTRLRVLDPVPLQSGPAAARNRALVRARGRFVALLDADDTWSPNYLAALLPLAERQGVAYGRTVIADPQGARLRAIPSAAQGSPARGSDQSTVGFGDFATAYGSLHGVVKRDHARRWQDLLAEDVLYDLESLGLAGGSAPYVAEAVYTLHVRPQSLSHGDPFIRDIDAGYGRLIDLIESGGTQLPEHHRAAAADVFRAWRRMNARFGAARANDPDLEFHAFVADLAPA